MEATVLVSTIKNGVVPPCHGGSPGMEAIDHQHGPRKASAAALTRAFHDAQAGDLVVPRWME